MKLQDVMLKAMGKRITWFQAAEILGISCRQMQRWKTLLSMKAMNAHLGFSFDEVSSRSMDVFITYGWQVDQDGDVLDILVQSQRNT